MERVIKKIHDIFSDTSLFRIAFIIDLFLCSVGYINVAAEVGKIFFFVWGLSLFVNIYLADMHIKKVNYFGWLVLFILSNIITLFIRGYSDGIWESVLMVLNMPILFFMLYGLHSEMTEEYGAKKLLKELYHLCNILMGMSLVLNIVRIISLYFLFIVLFRVLLSPSAETGLREIYHRQRNKPRQKDRYDHFHRYESRCYPSDRLECNGSDYHMLSCIFYLLPILRG